MPLNGKADRADERRYDASVVVRVQPRANLDTRLSAAMHLWAVTIYAYPYTKIVFVWCCISALDASNIGMVFKCRLRPQDVTTTHATPHSPPIPTQQRQQRIPSKDGDGRDILGARIHWVMAN